MTDENQGGSPAGADTGSAGTGGTTKTQQATEGSQTGQEGGSGTGGSQGSTKTDFSVPEAYKERGWAGKVKSLDDAFKLIDNQDQLIGKKTVTAFDYSKATPEEIAEHHAKLAPKDKSAYKFNAAADDAVAGAVAEAFMKAGLNEYQGNQVLQVLHPLVQKLQDDNKAASTSEEGYMKLAQAAFGEEFKKHLGKAEATLKNHAPDDACKKVFDDMPNDQRIAVDRTVNKIVEGYEARIAKLLKEHGINESGAQGEGKQGTPASNIDTQRKELREQIRKIDARPHTAAEKQALIEKLNATYKS